MSNIFLKLTKKQLIFLSVGIGVLILLSFLLLPKQKSKDDELIIPSPTISPDSSNLYFKYKMETLNAVKSAYNFSSLVTGNSAANKKAYVIDLENYSSLELQKLFISKRFEDLGTNYFKMVFEGYVDSFPQTYLTNLNKSLASVSSDPGVRFELKLAQKITNGANNSEKGDILETSVYSLFFNNFLVSTEATPFSLTVVKDTSKKETVVVVPKFLPKSVKLIPVVVTTQSFDKYQIFTPVDLTLNSNFDQTVLLNLTNNDITVVSSSDLVYIFHSKRLVPLDAFKAKINATGGVYYFLAH